VLKERLKELKELKVMQDFLDHKVPKEVCKELKETKVLKGL
jgi:hypothetical protein